MKSFIAGTIAISATTIGFFIGCVIWAVIGYCLGTAFSHAPISGALTGIAYQLGCFIHFRERMWDSTQEMHQIILQNLND